jgi:hypothetical protein
MRRCARSSSQFSLYAILCKYFHEVQQNKNYAQGAANVQSGLAVRHRTSCESQPNQQTAHRTALSVDANSSSATEGNPPRFMDPETLSRR